MKQRIIGIDVARALAVFGMVIVNFKIVIGQEGSTWPSSLSSIFLLAEGDAKTDAELQTILGTSPMPPLPFYMLNGIAIALVIIAGCILLTQRYQSSKVFAALYKTGQLALTFYVAHVLIGMGFIQVLAAVELGSYSLAFSLTYALIFCLLCVGFAVLRHRDYQAGPREWVIRKITD